MMEVLRTWLFGLTAVSLLLALAEALVSQEGIRRVLRLAGGVLMIVVLLQPVVQIDLEDLSLSLEAYQQDPRHQAVAAMNKSIRTDRVAVDYEV